MKNIFAKNISATVMFFLALVTAWQTNAKDISQNQLQEIMKSNKQMILLDVRTTSEFEDAHIPNAINISHNELSKRLAELSGAENTQIIIYCRSGVRAGIAKRILAANGFSKLDHLAGDFNKWDSNNLPILTGK